MALYGNAFYRGLVGAVPTGLTRFVEYVDGSIMADGNFSDASGTWIGDILYGTQPSDCFMIDEDGNVGNCGTQCVDEIGVSMQCEQVLCEKVLVPQDKSLCLDKGSVIPSKLVLDNSVDITIPVKIDPNILNCITFL